MGRANTFVGVTISMALVLPACGGTEGAATETAADQAALSMEPCSGDCSEQPGTDSDSPDSAHPSAQGRMTGGGRIRSDAGDVRHGFQLHCDVSDARENLEVNWGRGHRFHLDRLLSVACLSLNTVESQSPAAGFNTMIGEAIGTYDGEPDAYVRFVFTDAGEPGKQDTGGIAVIDADGNVVLSALGPLAGGNHQAH